MNRIEIGNKIRILRKMLGFKQEGLSTKAGVSIRVIKELESAKGNPTIGNVASVCEVLGVPVFKIFMPGMDSINYLISPETNKSNASNAELILSIQAQLTALDYDELNTVSSSIKDLIADRPSKPKATLTE